MKLAKSNTKAEFLNNLQELEKSDSDYKKSERYYSSECDIFFKTKKEAGEWFAAYGK